VETLRIDCGMPLDPRSCSRLPQKSAGIFWNFLEYGLYLVHFLGVAIVTIDDAKDSGYDAQGADTTNEVVNLPDDLWDYLRLKGQFLEPPLKSSVFLLDILSKALEDPSQVDVDHDPYSTPHSLGFLIPDDMLEKLKTASGDMSRARYVRCAVRAYMERNPLPAQELSEVPSLGSGRPDAVSSDKLDRLIALVESQQSEIKALRADIQAIKAAQIPLVPKPSSQTIAQQNTRGGKPCELENYLSSLSKTSAKT
jgi:hypothetical protein